MPGLAMFTRPFIDLHAHFPMHTPFPPLPFEDRRDRWKKGVFDRFNRERNYLQGKPRVSIEEWDKDADVGVSGCGSVLYDAADEFFVRHPRDPQPYAGDHLHTQLDNVETELRASGIGIARCPDEVDRFIEDGQRFVFHTIEGGFGLGAHTVESFAQRGVASIIPAHLLYRGVATCENAFPPPADLLFAPELLLQPKDGLSLRGEQMVEACFKRGVIVDITHAREDALRDIFTVASGYRSRPLISSHNSVRRVNGAPLNLSNASLDQIKASNGVVGVIFYTQWLGGGVEGDSDGISRVIEVLQSVIDYLKSDEHVAIGSDLDGFIEPIPGCQTYASMSRIADAVEHAFPGATAEKILHQNARRVLHAGWDGVR